MQTWTLTWTLTLTLTIPCQAAPEARDPAAWPFSPDSPWNLPLGSAARYTPPGDPCTRDLTDPHLSAWINAAEWSHPIYQATATDPLLTIYQGGKPIARLHLPRDARPAGPNVPESDAHLHVIDPSARFLDEMWHARPVPGGLAVESHTRTDLYGPGVGRGGERAYGGSAIGGLIRAPELAPSGPGIRHALALALPRSHLRRGPIWPASGEDTGAAGTYRGHVRMGQLVALPPDADLAALPLSAAGRAIARALRDYGAYVVDAADNFTLYADPALEPSLSAARDDLLKLRPLLRCVDNPQGAHSGAPRAPHAPPLRPAAVKGRASTIFLHRRFHPVHN